MANTVILVTVCIALAGVAAFFYFERNRRHEEVRRQSVTAEALYFLWQSNAELLIFDVRQPLDLLAYPEIIPRARRIPPDEVLQTPSLIPRDKDTVVYCTCPGDKTSRAVMQQARARELFRVKFLSGGLTAWKEKGYPVEPYREVFHLYKTAASSGGATLST